MERETERWEDGGCCVIKYLLLFFFILVLSSNVSEVGSFVLISFFSFRFLPSATVPLNLKIHDACLRSRRSRG
jgi:hypothetical protein